MRKTPSIYFLFFTVCVSIIIATIQIMGYNNTHRFKTYLTRHQRHPYRFLSNSTDKPHEDKEKKRQNENHRTTGSGKANGTISGANNTDYPLGIKVGALVKVVRDNGTIGVERRVGDRYRLLRRIGGGGFGHIFLGQDIVTGEKVAVKVDRFEKVNSTVRTESIIYRMLQGGEGFPRVKWSGREGNFNVMVIDLLGPSLQKYFDLCHHIFSLKTVLLLADQMIKRLEYLHYKGFVHRDISPVNFLVGIGERSQVVYSIDFGLSRRYRDEYTGRHLPYRHIGFAGTHLYSSINAQKGFQPSRRDDMESLGYVLLHFILGRLPWQGIKVSKSKRRTTTFQMKQNTTIDILCKGLPVEFFKYVAISRSLKYEEEPDYSYLRGLFRDVLQRYNLTSDHTFDWNVVNGSCSAKNIT